MRVIQLIVVDGLLLLAITVLVFRQARALMKRDDAARRAQWIPFLGVLVLAALALVLHGRHPRLAGTAEAPRRDAPPASPPRSKHLQPPQTPSGPWPDQSRARWPHQCLIANVAIHPQQPWLTAACTTPSGNRGAVLLFDAQTGRLRSSTALEESAGWSESAGALRWHEDGQRLATTVGTNGIALLSKGLVVGAVRPDDERDSAVRYVWVGDQLFTDTGALFEIQPGDERAGEQLPSTGAPLINEPTWNAAIGAVVGRVGDDIGAFDPVGKQLVYRVAGVATWSGDRWSSDGRWYAWMEGGGGGAMPRIHIHSGDDGRSHATVTPSLPHVRSLEWGPSGSLLIECFDADHRSGQRSATHLDLVEHGRITRTIDLGARTLEAASSVPEANAIAWSPSGEHVAVLLDRQEVQIRDVRTGQVVMTFAAPTPAVPSRLPRWYPRDSYPRGAGSTDFPGALLWFGSQRLVRLAPHFVSFWSIDGQKLAEFVVPD